MTKSAHLLLLWTASLAPVFAQSSYLSGRVLDSSEAGIAGATITVVDQNAGFRRVTESETDGAFVVGSLRPGLYKITARKQGFRTMIRFNVRLAPAQPARTDFMLSVGTIEETITVEGAAPLLNQEDASIGARIARDEIEALPLNGRGVLSLLELTPGVTVTPATRGEAGQFTANGQRPNSNSFTVDGISANTGVLAGGLPAQTPGASLPAMTAFGSLDSVIPIDSLEDLRVQTSTSGVAYGRLPGASIALNSRAGSNAFHGSVQYRFLNQDMAANDWFANLSGQSRAAGWMQSGRASLGGALSRNHAFFLLSWEGLQMQAPYVFRELVPSVEIRQNAPAWASAALNLFPAPNGASAGGGLIEWNGARTLPAGLNARSLRIDDAITSKITFFGRFSDAPSTNRFGSGQVDRLHMDSRSLTLGLNLRPASSLTFDLRANISSTEATSAWIAMDGADNSCALQRLVATVALTPVACPYLVRFTISGAGSIVAGDEGLRRQRQWQTGGALTFQHGAHAFKAGADFLRISPSRADASATFSIISAGLTGVDNPGTLWRSESDPVSSSIVVRQVSTWMEDEWRVSPRLTINAGLRWEFSPAPVPREAVNFLDPAEASISSRKQPLWRHAATNFAPRLGVAYKLTRNTVLRAGGGIYYDSSLSFATDALNGSPLNISQDSRSTPSGAFISYLLKYGFLANLQLPRVAQWSVSLEHAFGSRDALAISYAGAYDRDLVRRELDNQVIPQVWLALATNDGRSNYNSLQLQYRRRMTHGLQARASYVWSHSIDNASSDAFLSWKGTGDGDGDRGSSDFDLRHSFSAALNYELPKALHGWTLDGIFHARSGFPMAVLESDQYSGISLANAFRPDLVAGQPVWIEDASAPAGRRLNPEAFALLSPGQQGNLGRNSIAGFGMSQLDLALRREFHAGERAKLQLRIEGYNALNHPNFADPVRFLNSPLFGLSNSMLNLMLGSGSSASGLAPLLQSGGPRSVQASLRVEF